MSQLLVQGLSQHFNGREILSNVSLTVPHGTIVTLLGASGSGKTTLLRSIAGLDRCSSGIVRLDGIDVSNRTAGRRGIGMVFQDACLFPHLTARENIEFALRHSELDRAGRSRTLKEVVALSGLDSLVSSMPYQLSGGQRQRVALARALASKPKVLLLDEPLSALDVEQRHELRSLLIEAIRSIQATALYVTHDQTEALALGDTVAILHEGRIDSHATPRELFFHPPTAHSARFLGATNRVRVTKSADGNFHCGRLFVVGGRGITANSVDVYFHPENVRIVSPCDGERARVLHSEFTGFGINLKTETSTGHSVSIVGRAGESSYEAGAEINIAVLTRGLQMFPCGEG